MNLRSAGLCQLSALWSFHCCCFMCFWLNYFICSDNIERNRNPAASTSCSTRSCRAEAAVVSEFSCTAQKMPSGPSSECCLFTGPSFLPGTLQHERKTGGKRKTGRNGKKRPPLCGPPGLHLFINGGLSPPPNTGRCRKMRGSSSSCPPPKDKS